jgi:hypothetical protein
MVLRTAERADVFKAADGSSAAIGSVEAKANLETCSFNLPLLVAVAITDEDGCFCFRA